MSNRDIAETIFEATDILITKRLEGIKYDTTDVVTIIDDTNAKSGKYIVSTGSVSYVAYSNDTTYREGDCVYVTIPNGDYDNQKIISGKKVSGSEKPYVYMAPFDTIIDVSGNLFDISSDQSWSLIANFPSEESYNGQIPGNIIHIWDKSFTKENLIGFTRLGLKAQFMSWLAAWKTIKGDYGLQLTISYELKDNNSFSKACQGVIDRLANFTIQTSQEQIDRWNWITQTCPLSLESIINPITEKPYTIEKLIETRNDEYFRIINIINEVKQIQSLIQGKLVLEFNSDRFIGDPYNFPSYYEQEVVFDLSSLGDGAKITSMSLDFYEKPDSFKGLEGIDVKDIDENNQPLAYGSIPYTTGESFFENFGEPNLFVKDVYICLGYDLASFSTDTVKLYTVDSLTYKYIQSDKFTENDSLKKELQLRWVHEFDDGTFKELSQGNTENLNYEIRWYRYSLGEKAPDNYAGINWTLIPRNEGENLFTYAAVGEDQLDYKQPTEKFKVIILLFSEIDDSLSGLEKILINKYESNILEFTNEDELNNNFIYTPTDGYSLFCTDFSEGNYFVYGQNQSIKDQTDPYAVRQLQCYFKEPGSLLQPSVINEAEYIVWHFPARDSMIHLAESFSTDYTGLPSIREQMEDACEYDQLTDTDNVKKSWPGVEAITSWMTAPAFSIRRPGMETIQDLGSDSNTYLTKAANGTPYNGQKSAGDDNIYHVLYSGMYYDAAAREYVFAYKGDNNLNNFINPVLEYQILSNYHPDYLANTVTCEIITGGQTFVVSKSFYFGPASTNGSQYTVLIKFDDQIDDNDNKYVFTADTEETIKISAIIIGPGGHAIDINQALQYIWSWEEGTYFPTDNLIFIYNQNNPAEDSNDRYEDFTINDERNYGPVISLKHGSNNQLLESLLYLKCTIKGLESYDLIVITPIAIRNTIKYEKITGPSYIAYDASGHVNYVNEPFTLHDKRNATSNRHVLSSTEAQWEIYNPNNIISGFLGTVSADGDFTPLELFIKKNDNSDKVDQYGVKCKLNNSNNTLIYTQPIYCCQNRYPSGVLNTWDGKSLVIDNDKGLIMANSISAGKKNSDNTFSGVLMGDWSNNALDSESSISKQTGIYGFNHGTMSYSFTEDGTGFIGKSGKGRILFDGNESTIQSEAYQIDKGGMKIDLDDGIIDIRGNKINTNSEFNIPAGLYEDVTSEITVDNFNSNKNNLYIRIEQVINNKNIIRYKKVDIVNDVYNGNLHYYKKLNNSVDKGTGFYLSQNDYNLSGSQVLIQAQDPYLKVQTDNEKEIFHVGTNEYYLQTENWSSPSDNAEYTLVNSNKVNSTNYSNYYVQNINYEKDDNPTITEGRQYYEEANANSLANVVEYKSNEYYCNYNLDSSSIYNENKTYYTFNASTGTYIPINHEQDLFVNNYVPNTFYYSTNNNYVAVNNGSFNIGTQYYIKIAENEYEPIDLIDTSYYSPSEYYFYDINTSSHFQLDESNNPTLEREYFTQKLVYEEYIVKDFSNDISYKTTDGYYKFIEQDRTQNTYNNNITYFLGPNESIQLFSEDILNDNYIYYYERVSTIGLGEIIEITSQEELQDLYDNLDENAEDIEFFLKEEIIDEDTEEIIETNYNSIGYCYEVLKQTIYCYVLITTAEPYNSNITYYQKVGDNYIEVSENEFIIPPTQAFNELQASGYIYIQTYIESDLPWISNDDNFKIFYSYNSQNQTYNLINTQTEFNNTNIHYIKGYIPVSNSTWSNNIIYYVKDESTNNLSITTIYPFNGDYNIGYEKINKCIYQYEKIGLLYEILYDSNTIYYIKDENNINEVQLLIDLSIENFENLVNDIKNNIDNENKKYFYIDSGLNNSNTLNNILVITALDSSGVLQPVYQNIYNANYYYIYNENNKGIYNGNIYNSDYILYQKNNNNYIQCKIYEPDTYYYQIYTYSPALSYNNTINYYELNMGSGTKIDLEQGRIQSYNLSLEGYRIDNNGKIYNVVVTSQPTSLDEYVIKSGIKGNETFWVNWKGHIHSTSADIGNWIITSNAIKSQPNENDQQIILRSDGNIYANYNKDNKTGWKITAAGNAYFHTGTIGGWNIKPGELSSGTTYLFSTNQDNETLVDGTSKKNWRIKIEDTFGVDKAGNMYANTGRIGGWVFKSTYFAGEDTSGNKEIWLFSKNQSSKRSVQYKADGTLTSADSTTKQWRILVGYTPKSGSIAAHYKFGVNKNGVMFANKIYIPNNALFIDGKQVTIKDVTIPVAFKAVAQKGWVKTGTDTLGGGGTWVEETYHYKVATEYGYTYLVPMNTIPQSIEHGAAISQLSHTFKQYVEYPTYTIDTYSKQTIGYDVYITKVAKTKLLFSGTNGIVTQNVNYLLTSGNNKYGLVNSSGSEWTPTKTLKIFTLGKLENKNVQILGEIGMTDYD